MADSMGVVREKYGSVAARDRTGERAGVRADAGAFGYADAARVPVFAINGRSGP